MFMLFISAWPYNCVDVSVYVLSMNVYNKKQFQQQGQ